MHIHVVNYMNMNFKSKLYWRDDSIYSALLSNNFPTFFSLAVFEILFSLCGSKRNSFGIDFSIWNLWKKKSPSDGQIFTRGIEGISSFGEMEESAPRDQKQQSRLGWISTIASNKRFCLQTALNGNQSKNSEIS